MADNDKTLAPNSSPNTVVMPGKHGSRINRVPVIIGILIVTIIGLTLGMVMMGRSSGSYSEVILTGGKAATDRAREFIAMAEAGIVDPKQPDPLPVPIVVNVPEPLVVTVEEKKEELAAPIFTPPRTPEPVRIPEEVRKFREKRLRQVEAALDGAIKAQIDDVKITPRSLDAEIAAVERQIAALSGQGGDAYAERLAAIRAATEGRSGEADYSGRGDLSRMNQFSSVSGNWRNAAEVEAPPANLCIVRTGSVIPATLIGGINSDLPGQIVGQVAQDVYDTPTGKYLLIPQGSRLVGEYSSQVQYGQSRVFAVWQRIVFPDGKALDLGAMPGSSGRVPG